MFTASDFKARLRERPFRPFRVLTSDGVGYEVVHPELLFVAERWLTIGTPSKRDPSICRDAVRISRLHVTAIEDLEEAL